MIARRLKFSTMIVNVWLNLARRRIFPPLKCECNEIRAKWNGNVPAGYDGVICENWVFILFYSKIDEFLYKLKYWKLLQKKYLNSPGNNLRIYLSLIQFESSRLFTGFLIPSTHTSDYFSFNHRRNIQSPTFVDIFDLKIISISMRCENPPKKFSESKTWLG